MVHDRLARAVRIALRAPAPIALLALVAPAAFAQAPADDEVAEVVVTGTRIRQTTGMTTPVPVTSVQVQDLVKNNPGGALADQLDKLPQLIQTESAQRGSGALFGNAGASYVNLRGLGAQRTLVLLDGSRVVQDDRGGAVNIGVLPTGLIRSVDIVTGGASAQYGADAVGGVVNFILDRKFEGLKLSASSGVNEEGDGFNYKGGITAGTRVGDKLHVTASFDYNHIDQIERDPLTLGDYYQRWGYVANPAYVSAAATPGVPVRITAPNLSQPNFSPFGRIDNAYLAQWHHRGAIVLVPQLRIHAGRHGRAALRARHELERCDRHDAGRSGIRVSQPLAARRSLWRARERELRLRGWRV